MARMGTNGGLDPVLFQVSLVKVGAASIGTELRQSLLDADCAQALAGGVAQDIGQQNFLFIGHIQLQNYIAQRELFFQKSKDN